MYTLYPCLFNDFKVGVISTKYYFVSIVCEQNLLKYINLFIMYLYSINMIMI